MEHRDWKNSLQETAGRHASRRGAFSAGLTALAVAAVLVFNLLAQIVSEFIDPRMRLVKNVKEAA